MKNNIINKLNSLHSNDVYIHAKREKDVMSWVVALKNENYSIEVSKSEYEIDQIQLTFKSSFNKTNIAINAKELKPFLNTLRQGVENAWSINGVLEEKRKQLINLFSEAKNTGFLNKEVVEKVEGNEEQQYYLRIMKKNIEVSDLEILDFLHVQINQLTRDKRLADSKCVTQTYELALSNEEVCEMFNINLQEEKEKQFETDFGYVFKYIKADTNLAQDYSTDIMTNTINESTSISKKIKRIL